MALGAIVTVLTFGIGPNRLCAQDITRALLDSLVLQDVPALGDSIGTLSPQTAEPQSSASIVGTIRDTHGSPTPGVQVTLVGPGPGASRMIRADSEGTFTFADLPAGHYQLKIEGAGIQPSTSAELVLETGEKRDLSMVARQLPLTRTTVRVVATRNEVAQAQIKQQEKQRILGFLPNYYTSYIWDAAPLTPKLKFKLALRTTTDPVTFLVAAGIAGAEQKHKTFPGYGQGPEGYAKRYGATYADMVVNRMVSSAILPTVLHQDPRYFYRGSGSIRSRVLYALAESVVCRRDDGRVAPNYSRVLGAFATAGLSNIYRAPEDRRVGLTLRNGLIITGSGAVVNLLREFLSRKLTPNVPVFANGKP